MKRLPSAQYEQFILVLRDYLDKTRKESISNETLRQNLGWERQIYFGVKQVLLARNLIDQGKGRGGSVQITKKARKYLEELAPLIASAPPPPADTQNAQDENDDESTFEDSDSFITDLDAFVFCSQEERDAFQFLNAVLRLKDLREIFSSSQILKHVRPLAKLISNQNSNEAFNKKAQIACIVTELGVDLLSDVAVREVVAERLGIKKDAVPRRWISGGYAARKFVTDCKLAEVFAGAPEVDKDAHVHIPGKTKIPTLKTYQAFGRDEALRHLLNPEHRKCVLSLPTGTGKTRTASELIVNWCRHRSSSSSRLVLVWLAHNEELLEQAFDEVTRSFNSADLQKSVDCFRFWGDYKKDLDRLDQDTYARLVSSKDEVLILFSTPQSILALLHDSSDTISQFQKSIENCPMLVVIDEAHRALARTYVDAITTLNHFTSDLAYCGLTATPRRSSGTVNELSHTSSLFAMFNNLIVEPLNVPHCLISDETNFKYTNPRAFLEDTGILSQPVFEEFQTGFSVRIGSGPISELSDDTDELEADSEVFDQQLRELINTNARRLSILRKVIDEAKSGLPIIYFGPSVQDSINMAFLLRARGIKAASLHGGTKLGTRRKIISEFKSNQIQVLCNCELLTAGFDYPKISTVIIARPTVSTVLYEQMIGRGLRGPNFGGTEVCKIVNCVDSYFPDVSAKFAFRRVIANYIESRKDLPAQNVNPMGFISKALKMLRK